jgi:hypothetical protein
VIDELAVLRAARAALWTDEEWSSTDAYRRARTPTGTADWSATPSCCPTTRTLLPGEIVVCRDVTVSRTGEVSGTIVPIKRGRYVRCGDHLLECVVCGQRMTKVELRARWFSTALCACSAAVEPPSTLSPVPFPG